MNDSQTEHPQNTPDTGFTEAFLAHALTPQNVGVLASPDGFGSPGAGRQGGNQPRVEGT
jgi:hypothetical protein